MSFVVAVKPSARKRNAKVGQLVFEEGTRRTFADRAAAERWARALTTGDGHVWIAAAHPRDDSDADAYLVSRASNAKLEAAYDKRRKRLRNGSGRQRSLGSESGDEPLESGDDASEPADDGAEVRR